MPVFPPGELAQWTGGRWTATPTSPLTGFTIDTRTLRPGEVFVALRTGKRDGHDFLAAARTAGAGAALVAQPDPAVALPQLVVAEPLTAFQAIAREHRRRFGGPVVGITGSAGKTSTKNLLALLLGGPPEALATEGNLNNHLGVPLTLTRLDPAVHRFAVIEAGISGPGEMKVLADMIEPDIAIVTLVAPAHLEELGGLEGVAREKALLPAAIRPAGVAIFPRKCNDFMAFRELDVRTITIELAAVVRPSDSPKEKVYFAYSQRGERTAVSIAYGQLSPQVFEMRRISAGMAQNAALALCAALWLGVPGQLIQARLAGWTPGSLRGEWRDEDGRLLYLDCYNANPASMADALESFATFAPADRPRLFVIGGMEELGTRAAEYHHALGESLPLRPEDFLFVIGDNAPAVCAGALVRGSRADQIEVVTSLAPVAERLAAFRGAVFIKGSRRWQLERVLPPAAAAAAH